KSCAAWLSWKIGLAPGPAREHVRVVSSLLKNLGPRLSGGTSPPRRPSLLENALHFLVGPDDEPGPSRSEIQRNRFFNRLPGRSLRCRRSTTPFDAAPSATRKCGR